MQNSINLIIGGTDISEFVEQENYSIKKVWKTESQFTNFDGTEIIKYIGWNYRLSASFENIPDDMMKKLTAALDNDVISITFTDPHSENMITTDNFQRGESTGGSVSYGSKDGLYWSLSIDLTSGSHSGNGL